MVTFREMINEVVSKEKKLARAKAVAKREEEKSLKNPSNRKQLAKAVSARIGVSHKTSKDYQKHRKSEREKAEKEHKFLSQNIDKLKKDVVGGEHKKAIKAKLMAKSSKSEKSKKQLSDKAEAHVNKAKEHAKTADDFKKGVVAKAKLHSHIKKATGGKKIPNIHSDSFSKRFGSGAQTPKKVKRAEEIAAHKKESGEAVKVRAGHSARRDRGPQSWGAKTKFMDPSTKKKSFLPPKREESEAKQERKERQNKIAKKTHDVMFGKKKKPLADTVGTLASAYTKAKEKKAS